MMNTGFKKINIGFLVIVLVALAHSVISFYIISKNNNAVTRMVNDINPYVESLGEFNLMVTESKMYSTNWVYLQFSEEDKKNLQKLHSKKYPALKKRLLEQFKKTGNKDGDSLRHILSQFDRLMAIEQMIMVKLTSFDDYENPQSHFQAEGWIEDEVLPRTDSIKQNLEKIIDKNRKEAEELKDKVVASSNKLMQTVFGFSLGLLAAVLLAAVFISRAISQPVLRMKKIITQLGRGELSSEKLKVTPDVIGSMVSSVNTLTHNFETTSQFANEIRKGNFSVDFQLLSENDQLGHALINMRNSLKAYAEEMEQKVSERTREVTEKNQKLEVAYSEIRDSINYAKRIQEAILPPEDFVYECLKECFILYKPKDVVSGDFYWLHKLDDKVLFAAVDCTGHGVPGALMSVLSYSALNTVINQRSSAEPAKILNFLCDSIKETFRHQHYYSDVNDGMDLGICALNRKEMKLSYAGAKISLCLVRDGELTEVKGDKQTIAARTEQTCEAFTHHEIALKKGDCIYIFSDGYADQFGGEKGKKFKHRQLKEFLVSIAAQPMHQQKIALDNKLATWKGALEQVDDILVFGVRI